MSQFQTQQMGRLVAAGSKNMVSDAIGALASLNALHFIEYDGAEDGFSLGSPEAEAEEVGRNLSKLRSAASIINPSGPSNPVSISEVRNDINEKLSETVDLLLKKNTRLDEVENSLSSINEEEVVLNQLLPLGIEIELLSGYKNITSFVGLVTDLGKAEDAGSNGMFFSGESKNKDKTVAVFIQNNYSNEAQMLLNEAGFQSINIPLGEGNIKDLIAKLQTQKEELESEKTLLEESISSWNDEYGSSLVCGLELLERDHDMLTAPVKIAVSEHAFLIDGWIEMSRSEEVINTLKNSCLYSDVTAFVIKAGQGGHGHSDHSHNQKMPPIAFQERTVSKPMELLTDAVGRPAYGRIDPTIFMFVTYPIFFGMMLGDMAYGIITMALGILLVKRAGTNDMLLLGGKFLTYIGLGTLIFGYIYAEFAGWEIFPHFHSNPAESLQFLYFDASTILSDGHLWEYSISSLGLEFAFPFHRVLPSADGGNLEHLIVLAIYVGFIHVFFGLLIGFRDILLYGNGHGGIGFVCALFEKGSWMILLVGGFLFAYGFLGPEYGLDSQWMLMPGVVIAVIATLMLMWTLYKYHGVPFPINIGLAPIEAIGMMPTVISYVRLFAVGVVGVKIAETGNEKLFDPMVTAWMDSNWILVPIFFIAWLLVQFFAWGLGVFSPNIHAARLHFVEWMRQYYDSSGEDFSPFGFRSRHVEVE